MAANGSPTSLAASELVRHRWANTPDRNAADLARFESRVDPDGLLPPDERTRQAEQARKAHYAELGRRSGEARRARRPRNIDEVVDQIVNAAPELSTENRARLQALLGRAP